MKNEAIHNCLSNDDQIPEFPDGLFVLAIVDSFYEKKSLRPLDCLWNAREEFEYLGIPVYILSPKKNRFQSDKTFHYIYDESLESFYALQAIKKKSVFGKDREVIYACIVVFDGDKLIYKANSMNDSSLKKVLIFLVKIGSKKFLKKIEKKFDKR